MVQHVSSHDEEVDLFFSYRVKDKNKLFSTLGLRLQVNAPIIPPTKHACYCVSFNYAQD
jgi:hypothetical protein